MGTVQLHNLTFSTFHIFKMPISQQLLRRISKNISVTSSKTGEEIEPPAKKFRDSMDSETSSDDEHEASMTSSKDSSSIIPNINDTLARLGRFGGLSIIKAKNVDKSADFEDEDNYNESDHEGSGSDSEHEDSAEESDNEESFTVTRDNDGNTKSENEKNIGDDNVAENEASKHPEKIIRSSKIDTDKERIDDKHTMKISSHKDTEQKGDNTDDMTNNKGAKDASDDIDDLLFSDFEDDSTDEKVPRKIENIDIVEFDSDNE